MSPPPPSPPPPSPPSSSSSDHPLSILTHTLLTSPLSTRLLDDSSSLLTRRIRQASSRYRTLSRLDSLRAQLASSLEAGGSHKNEWADSYARGLEDFERDWDSSASSFSSTGGTREEIWSKLPSFAGKVAVGGIRALLEDPFRTGKHLSSLGGDVFVKTQGGGDSEVEVVLELVSSLLGSQAVLYLVEGFASGVVQELVGEEGGGGANSSSTSASSDPARQRELESCFVSMMSLVHGMVLEVVVASTPEDVVPRGGSPFAFGKSLELVLLEALAAPDPSSPSSDLARPSATRKRPPPLARNHHSSLSTSTEEAGWGATFSSLILGAPPSSPGPSADFPWAKRGGWVPAGEDTTSLHSVQTQREPTGGLLRADTRSISGPSPILKSPLGGRMFRSPSLSSFGSSSVTDSSSNLAVKSFSSLAASVLRLLSRPTSSADATSTPSPMTTTTLPLLQALSIFLLRTHFPFATHPKSHRRLLLLLIVRWYSFHLLQRVLTGSTTTSPPLPLPDRGVSLTSVQGDAPNLKFAGAGAGGKGGGLLLGDVWKGEKGGAKLDKLHLRVHLALVEAAGFGSAGSSGSSGAGLSGKLGAGHGEEDEEELSRAAKRVLEAFGAGVALTKSSVESESQDASSPKIGGPTGGTGIEVDTLNALEISLKELLPLLRIARPLVAFSNSLGSSGGGGGLAGFRRGSDFKGGRFNATGAGRWGASSSSDALFAEEDFDVVQEGIARLESQPSSVHSVILFASPSPTQGTFSLSFSIPEIERSPSFPVQSSSPSMGRNGGTYGTTPAKGGGGRRGSAASTTSYNSPTMSPSLDGGSDYFGLPMVLEELSEGGYIGKLEKEVIFRALLNLVKDGHLSTLPSNRPFPELVPLLAQAAESSQDNFDFANTLSYRQGLEGLIQVTKNHPHLALRNFAPLLSALIASAVAAESTKGAQLQLVQMRLLEVDQKESALLLGARRVISALNDLRTRVYFVFEVLPSERIERLRSTLTEIKSGEVDPDDEGEVTTWLAETNLAVDFSVGDTKLHASCFLVDRALRRIADPKVLFRSSLWKREAVLAGPFLEEDLFVPPSTTTPPLIIPSSSSSSTSLSCLSFGAISTSLLRPGEPRSPQLSYLNTFILRLRTRITGYLLAELESQGDVAFPADTWFEKESYLLPGASSIIPKEWTSPLLRTFLLHPSPHAKLQALFSLEMLCVSQKVAPFTSPTPSDETIGLPASLSFPSAIRTTPPRHTLREPKSSSGASPTMHRISRAIDNHPHHSANEAAGGGGSASAGGGGVPDAFWSLGASLSSYVFGAPAAGGGASGVGLAKLDSRDVRESSSSLLEPPNTDELVDELSKIVVRHRPENLSSCLVKIAFFVPGEILDFRPEGKAYLDFGLACLTLRTDLLDILHAEAKEIVRKGGYATKEERARALELLDVCAREGSDEARREVKSLMSPWIGGGGGGLVM